MRRLGIATLYIFMGWHVWKILDDHNADKAVASALIVIALSMLVVLYSSTRCD